MDNDVRRRGRGDMNSCGECMIWKVSSFVRSGNQDLDFEMRISDFAIESEI